MESIRQPLWPLYGCRGCTKIGCQYANDAQVAPGPGKDGYSTIFGKITYGCNSIIHNNSAQFDGP